MKSRAKLLYGYSFKAIANRLRYDLVQELVVFICSSVIFATFIYVFDDFLNEDVARLSQLLRNQLALPCALGLFSFTAVLTARQWRKERGNGNEWVDWTTRLGESPQLANRVKSWRLLTTALLLHALLWLNIHIFIWPLNLTLLFVGEPLLITIAWLLTCVRGEPKPSKSDLPQAPPLVIGAIEGTSSNGRHQALVRWRWVQILRRKRPLQLALVLSTGFLSLATLAVIRSLPLFASWILCFAAGNMTSWVIARQAADDLRHGWSEKSLGLSHKEFISIYSALSIRFSLMLCCPIALLWSAQALTGTTWLQGYLPWITLMLSTPVCVLIMPDLLLQVDGHRPFIQMTLVTLLGLFIATAIYAHPIAVVLVFLLKYYAAEAQNNRYYRA